MEYVYATLTLNETGMEINERNLTSVLEAAGAEVVESRVKAIVAALEDVDLDDIGAEAGIAPAPTVDGPDEGDADGDYDETADGADDPAADDGDEAFWANDDEEPSDSADRWYVEELDPAATDADDPAADDDDESTHSEESEPMAGDGGADGGDGPTGDEER